MSLSMSTHRHIARALRHLGAETGSVVLLALIAVGLWYAVPHLGERQSSTGFISSEVQFTDASPQGLAIVPASCPSDPHYTGECDPEEGISKCSISNSKGTIDKGERVRISWLWSPITDPPQFAPVTYIAGSILPDIGAVGITGARNVTPSETTVYTYSGLASSAGLIRSFSCTTRVTIKTILCL